MKITFDQIGLDQIKLDPTCEIRDEVWPALTENCTGEERGVISDFRQRRAEN